MIFYKSVLYRVSFAKYAVAFFKISLSCFSILFSRLRRFSSSWSVSSWVFVLLLFPNGILWSFLYAVTQEYNVTGFISKSFATFFTFSLLFIINWTVESLNSFAKNGWTWPPITEILGQIKRFYLDTKNGKYLDTFLDKPLNQFYLS